MLNDKNFDENIPANGNWGQWGRWARCSKSCRQTRYRNCDDPEPKESLQLRNSSIVNGLKLPTIKYVKGKQDLFSN